MTEAAGNSHLTVGSIGLAEAHAKPLRLHMAEGTTSSGLYHTRSVETHRALPCLLVLGRPFAIIVNL